LPENTIVLIEETKIEVVQKNIVEDKSLTTYDLPLTTPKPKRELPKSSSIGNMLKDIHQEVVQENKEVKVELTEESLPELWTQFLSENREKLQNAFLSVAERQKPLLADGEITFIETNNISLELLQLHKIDIVSFFIKKTTSPTVHLNFKLNKKEELTKNYKTAKDRLKDMIDENPAVLELIKKLELSLE
jgi:hypothetical protein